MDIEKIIKTIKVSLIKRKFIYIPFIILGLIVGFKPFIDLFGIKYKPVIGIVVFAVIILISIILISIPFIMNRNISGITTFYVTRNNLSPEYWQNFFIKRKRPNDVYLLGQSLSKTFNDKKRLETFISWCNKGTNFKIILLSPKNTEISQLQDIGKGIKNTYGTHPNKNLIHKIENTYTAINENLISKIHKIEDKPQIRFATCNLPFSINAIDDDMLITIYGTNAEADDQPTLYIKSKNSESYRSFINEFITIWNNYSKVLPDIDPVIKDLKKEWQTLITLNNNSISIPPPIQAILFPTYRCAEKCDFCMFESKRNNIKDECELDMGIDTFKKILNEIKINNVKKIEITGGGEPFEHPQIGELLNQLRLFRDENPLIKIGLLTNGLHLNKFDSKDLLYIFNDYIRISRYDRILSDQSYPNYNRENALWEENISKLQVYKRNNNNISTNIGIKYLLNKNNLRAFSTLVKNDLKRELFHNFDHYRFKAERRIKNDEITDIEHEIFYAFQESDIPNIEKKLSISLTNYIYPQSFKCWISPISCVFSPKGNLNLCCNYTDDEHSKSIGNINNYSFNELWNSKKHFALRRDLERRNCDKPKYANCRFAEIQDILEHFTASIGDLD